MAVHGDKSLIGFDCVRPELLRKRIPREAAKYEMSQPLAAARGFDISYLAEYSENSSNPLSLKLQMGTAYFAPTLRRSEEPPPPASAAPPRR